SSRLRTMRRMRASPLAEVVSPSISTKTATNTTAMKPKTAGMPMRASCALPASCRHGENTDGQIDATHRRNFMEPRHHTGALEPSQDVAVGVHAGATEGEEF